jgi:hypothetical protein
LGWRSSVLIVILVFGILFSLLSVADLYRPAKQDIPNKPAISQVQAFESVKRYLQANASKFQGILMQVDSNQDDHDFTELLISDSDFVRQGRHLPLYYYHRNMTVYQLDADSQTGEYKIAWDCDGNENIYCFHSADDRDWAPIMGKLMYEVGGMQFLYKTRDADKSTYRWELFLVDAANGDVVYTTFHCSERRPQWCR